MTVTDGLLETSAITPMKTGVICGETRFNYQDVLDRVRRVSSALTGLGLKRGDRVAILALNCHRYFELYYAVPQMGCIVVPINFRLSVQEVTYIVNHSGSRALVVDDAMAGVVDGMRGELGSLEHFISIGSRRPGFVSYEELAATGSPDYTPPETEERDPTGFFYTSGTTGEPKGVMLSHGNILANTRHTNAIMDREENEIYLHAAPMFHLADGAAVYSGTTRRVTHVFTPRFEPRAVLEIVSRERVTSLLLVPTMINFLLQVPDLGAFDLSSIRHITYGASPIAPDLLQRAMKTFQCRFRQGYGLTEAAPLLTALLPEDHKIDDDVSLRRLASCGRPVPGVDVRVVQEDGTVVRPGEVGEIIARGPNVMLGYWNRPEDTAAAVRDGWLYTGDLATVDDEGYIYLVDRKKDMIVTGGENVFSTEVEAALYEHPSVKEAAVIPVPHPEWGEAVHACITLVDGVQVTEQDVVDFCRARLASYKIPRSVEFVEGELPKGGTGKILKKELRERHWQGMTRKIN